MRRAKTVILALALLVLGLIVAACSAGPTPPSPDLAKPAAWMKEDCGDLPPIPVNDGDPKVRAKYYAVTRPMFVNCKLRHRGLNGWSNIITTKR